MVVSHKMDRTPELGIIADREGAVEAARLRVEEMKNRVVPKEATQEPPVEQRAPVDPTEALLKNYDLSQSFISSHAGKAEEEALAKSLAESHLFLHCHPRSETSKTERKASRMAWSGIIDPAPNYGLLSETFKVLQKQSYTANKVNEELAKSYNLSASPVWKVLKEFPQFAAMEEMIRNGLSKYGVDQGRDLAKLTIDDFHFIMYKEVREKKGRDGSGTGAERFDVESGKEINTKRFIKENEKEFRAGLLKYMGVSDKDAGAKDDRLDKVLSDVEKACAEVRKANAGKSPKEIQDLEGAARNKVVKASGFGKEEFKKALLDRETAKKNAGLDLKKKEYVDALVEAMKSGRLDISWQKEGGVPKWEGMPTIDIHHIINIKDAALMKAQGRPISDINSYTNTCFVIRDQHDLMHVLENGLNNGNENDICNDVFETRKGSKVIYRIQPPEGALCFFGADNIIFHTEKDESRGLSEQKPNVMDDATAKRDAERRGQKYGDPAQQAMKDRELQRE